MIANRVQPEFIETNRIDPDYYRPEHLADVERLRAFGSDQLGTIGRFFAGPFGSKLPSNLYLTEGIPLFRVGNVGSMEVLMDDMAHLAPAVHHDLRSSEVIPGDLLIVKASVSEKICRVPGWMPHANITQHIIGVRPNGDVDMDYITAFLFCQYGCRQLLRRSLGSIIQYLGVTDAKTVLFPRVGTLAQRSIGEKVRNAEALREMAFRLRKNITNLVDRPDLIEASQSPDPKTNVVAAADLRPRLDSKYYGMRAMSVEKASWSLNGAGISAHHPTVSNGFESREFVESGRRYVTVSEVSSGRLSLESAPLIPLSVEVPEKATLTPTCVLVVRTGSIGIAVKVHEEDTDAVISSHLIRLEFETEALAAAVAAFLSSQAGQILQHKISYGAVQPQIGQDELLRLPLPDPILQQGETLAELFDKYESCIRYASRLTTASKLLVEALIEGKVAEDELAFAQEALERGDPSADRALLARLSLEGIDVPGQPPLFPSLDALYELLNEVSEAETE